MKAIEWLPTSTSLMVSQWQSKDQKTGKQRVAPGRGVATSDSTGKMVAITTQPFFFSLFNRYDILRFGRKKGFFLLFKAFSVCYRKKRHMNISVSEIVKRYQIKKY